MIAPPVVALAPLSRRSGGTGPVAAALAMHLGARGHRVAFRVPAADAPLRAMLALFAPVVPDGDAPPADATALIALGAAPGAALSLHHADTLRDRPRGPAASLRLRWMLRRGPRLIATGPSAAAPWPRPLARALPALLPTGMDWAGARVLLAAAAPDMPHLAAALAAAGATVAGRAPLDPQGAVPSALAARLLATAAALRAQVAAPEADLLRLPPALRRQALALPVRLTLAGTAPLDAALTAAGL